MTSEEKEEIRGELGRGRREGGGGKEEEVRGRREGGGGKGRGKRENKKREGAKEEGERGRREKGKRMEGKRRKKLTMSECVYTLIYHQAATVVLKIMLLFWTFKNFSLQIINTVHSLLSSSKSCELNFRSVKIS